MGVTFFCDLCFCSVCDDCASTFVEIVIDCASAFVEIAIATCVTGPEIINIFLI
jgi:hypothetical protein